jgi:hypothetical protein
MVRMSMVTLKPFGRPALASSCLGLGHVELVGLSVLAPSRPLRHEVLVDHADVLDQRVADGAVVDQVFQGLAHFGLGQVGVLLVQADVVDRALGRGGELHVLVGREGGDVLRAQVAGDVDVAFFQQQALRGRFLHVAVDHARQLALVP